MSEGDKLTAWPLQDVLQVPLPSRWKPSCASRQIPTDTRRDDGRSLCVFIGLDVRTPRQTKEGVMHEDPRYFRVWMHSSAMLNRGMAGTAPPSFYQNTTNNNTSLLLADVTGAPSLACFRMEICMSIRGGSKRHSHGSTSPYTNSNKTIHALDQS